jgi:hypothetical protein
MFEQLQRLPRWLKIPIYVVLPILALAFLLYVLGAALLMAQVGFGGFFGYVSFEPVELKVYYAGREQPVPGANVEVTWVAGKYIVFDTLWRDIATKSFRTDPAGACRIPSFSARDRMVSMPIYMRIDISHNSVIPQQVSIDADGKSPVKNHEFTGGMSLWRIEDRTITVWLDPRQMSLQGNAVVALLKEEDHIWAGVVPENTASNTRNLLWSRYDGGKKVWELEAPEPKSWSSRKIGWTLVKNPKIRDSDGTSWEIDYERAKGYDRLAKREVEEVAPVLVHKSDDGSQVIRKYTLFPEVISKGHKCLALTDSYVWLSTWKLCRIDKTDGTIKTYDHKDGLVGHIKTILADSSYVWIGTNGNGINRFNIETERFDYFTY